MMEVRAPAGAYAIAMHFGKKAILLLGDRYLTSPFERPGTIIGVRA